LFEVAILYAGLQKSAPDSALTFVLNQFAQNAFEMANEMRVHTNTSKMQTDTVKLAF
jgi:hypothetical protein